MSKFIENLIKSLIDEQLDENRFKYIERKDNIPAKPFFITIVKFNPTELIKKIFGKKDEQ